MFSTVSTKNKTELITTKMQYIMSRRSREPYPNLCKYVETTTTPDVNTAVISNVSKFIYIFWRFISNVTIYIYLKIRMYIMH